MNEQRRLMSVEEVLRDVLPIGRTKLYDEIRAGRLQVVKIGRRTLIASTAIDNYLDALTAQD